jgi:ABC-2 type transport system ATP-binding protein
MTAAISFEGVSKHLSGRQVLKDVDFAVESGDIFGCLGPNGAGKTTTIRIILGLLKASAGTTRVLGSDPREDRIRNKVGFLLEVDGLYDNLSARDNLGYYGRLYGVHDVAGRIAAVLEGAGLSDRALDKVSTYSKGMRQRLALARSILHEPEVLILDEPTAGLDPGGQLDVRRMLLELSRTEGKTIFLSSHNLDEMQRLCNRIVLIHGGEIKLYGDLKQLARGSGRRGAVIETSTPIPAEVLAELLQATGAAVESQARTLVTLSGGADFEVPRAVDFLVRRGVPIEQVTKQQDSLEDLYLRIEAEARAAGEAPQAEPVAAEEEGPLEPVAAEAKGPHDV